MALFKQEPKKEIAKVKVLGIRTSEQTKVLATYNSTMYSILVEYVDGTRVLKELNSFEMKEYLQYIEM